MFNVKHNEKVQALVIDPGSAQGLTEKLKVNAIVVTLSEDEKDLLYGYRDKGNENV